MLTGDRSTEQGREAGEYSGRAWILLLLLAAAVAFTGGASRFDAVQIVFLRTFSALLFVSSLFLLSKEKWTSDRSLIAMLGCFFLIPIVQLLPLPPWLWAALPNRVAIIRLDAVLGLEDMWRPLTLDPMRTWNALASLVVPASGLLIAVSLRASSTLLLRVIAGLGVFNALMGLLQIAAGRSSIFYLYHVTNRGAPVGILANENHAGMFAACSMLVVTSLGLKARRKSSASWEKLVYPAAFFFILFISLVGGSRAAFLAAIGAILVSMLMLLLAPRRRHNRRAGGLVRGWISKRPRLALVAPMIVASLTAASFLALDRAPAFQDIIAKDHLADLRWSFWPVIIEMLESHWFLGTGLGSFELVYHIYEPSELLLPVYINQAHNDWAQLIIEGGVFAGLLLIGLLGWVVREIGVIAVRREQKANALFWVSVFAILSAASVIDYPLRTPLFQLTAVWLLLALSRDARGINAT